MSAVAERSIPSRASGNDPKFTLDVPRVEKEMSATTAEGEQVLLRVTAGTRRERTVIVESNNLTDSKREKIIVEGRALAYLTQSEALQAIVSTRGLIPGKKRTLLVAPILDANNNQVGKLTTERGLGRHSITLETNDAQGEPVKGLSVKSDLFFARGTTALRRAKDNLVEKQGKPVLRNG